MNLPTPPESVRRHASALALSIALTGALGLAATQASAQVSSLAPSIFVFGDGSVIPADVAIRPGQTPDTFIFTGAFANSDFSLSFEGTTKADPFILWAVGATNLTANPVNFAFLFLQPVIGGPYNTVTSNFSGSVTDLRGDGVSANVSNEVSLNPGGLVAGSQIGGLCTYGSIGPAFSGPCPLAPQLAFGPVTNSVAAQNYIGMSTTLQFTLSPFDSAAFSGAAILDTTVIPVPASLPLFIGGLAVGLMAWRRRRATA